MNDLPPAYDLLETALGELRSHIQPRLEATERYLAAMIGRAMQLAARELALGAAMREREREALAALPGAPDADLEELRRWLVAAIRRGDFDRTRLQLEAALEERVAARLALTDPSYR